MGLGYTPILLGLVHGYLADLNSMENSYLARGQHVSLASYNLWHNNTTFEREGVGERVGSEEEKVEKERKESWCKGYRTMQGYWHYRPISRANQKLLPTNHDVTCCGTKVPGGHKGTKRAHGCQEGTRAQAPRAKTLL